MQSDWKGSLTQKTKTLKSCPFESPALGDTAPAPLGASQSQPGCGRRTLTHPPPARAGTAPSGARLQVWPAGSDAPARRPRGGEKLPQEAVQPGARSRPAPPASSGLSVGFALELKSRLKPQTRISVGRVPSPHGDLRWRPVRPGRPLLAFRLQPSGSCCRGQRASGGRGPPGPTGSPGATGEAPGARLPQAATPPSRHRPLCPRAGGAALACDPQAHSREPPPPSVLGTALHSPRLQGVCGQRVQCRSLHVAGGCFQTLLARTAVSTRRLEPRCRGPGRTQARVRPPPQQDCEWASGAGAGPPSLQVPPAPSVTDRSGLSAF